MSEAPDPHFTAADLAKLLDATVPTIRRWASEDQWQRTLTRPTRYRYEDACDSFARRRAAPAA